MRIAIKESLGVNSCSVIVFPSFTVPMSNIRLETEAHQTILIASTDAGNGGQI